MREVVCLILWAAVGYMLIYLREVDVSDFVVFVFGAGATTEMKVQPRW